MKWLLGFLINATLALFAHLAISDGQWMGSAMALLAVLVSRIFLDARTNPS